MGEPVPNGRRADGLRVAPFLPGQEPEAPAAPPPAAEPDAAATTRELVRVPPAPVRTRPVTATVVRLVAPSATGAGGHRRVPVYQRYRLRAVLAMVAALGIAVVSAVLVLGRPADSRQAAPPPVPGVLPASPTAGPAVLAGSGDTTPTPGTRASGRGTGRPAVPVPGSTPSVPASGSRSDRGAGLAPVAYEAEAPGNTLGGSAWSDAYPGTSGGRLVRNIGAWGMPRGPGTLRFNGVTVPAAGPYRLTYFAVHLDNEPTRTLVITVTGGSAQTVTVTASSACCAGASVTVTLAAGSNSITFGNPAGHGPSIDRITVAPA